MRTYYIENLGSKTLSDELTTNCEGVVEHRQMACLDRQGGKRVRDLYEVPEHIKDRVTTMARKAGFAFNLYLHDLDVPGSLPREYYSNLVPQAEDPFGKAARARRRRQPRAVPASFKMIEPHQLNVDSSLR